MHPLPLVLAALLGVSLLAGCANDTADSPAPSAPQAAPQSVACVGDSNTQGYHAESYTTFLAQYLGSSYHVTNYGQSGTTAMTSSAHPYSDTAAYRDSLAAQPDIVVLMFGTNDTASWHGADTFAREYAALVERYRTLESTPRIILCTPPAPHIEAAPGQVSFGVQPAAYPSINAAITDTANAHHLTLIDIYSLTQNHPDWFLDDGIHLTNQGARAVAEKVAEAVKSGS